MNRKQLVAIIQRGYFTDGDLADALLAELAKVSEPVAWLQTSVEDGVDTVIARTYKPDKFNAEWWRFDPLYLHPLPQPDLVAEIERLGSEIKRWSTIVEAWHNTCNELRQQLSAAQAGETELLTALEEIADLKGTEQCEWDAAENVMPGMALIAEKAIAAHKSRKE